MKTSSTILAAAALVVAAGGCDRRSAPPAPAPAAVTSTDGAVPAAPSAQEGDAIAGLPADAPTVTGADGGFTVRYRTLPDPIEPREPFVIEAELFADAACTTRLADVPPATLTFDAAMPHHGHGMNVRPTSTSLGGGRYRITGILFHMPGRWEMFFDRTVDGVTERAQRTIEIKDLADAAPPSPRTP
jgi:hypothetical protein